MCKNSVTNIFTKFKMQLCIFQIQDGIFWSLSILVFKMQALGHVRFNYIQGVIFCSLMLLLSVQDAITYAFKQSLGHLCSYSFQDAILVSLMRLLYSKCNLWVIYVFKMQDLGHVCFYYIHDAIVGSLMFLLYSRLYLWITYALPIYKMQSFCHI